MASADIESFRIVTHPDGPGKGFWCWVRVYETKEDLHKAAHKHHPWYGKDSWHDTIGVCQTVPYRAKVGEDGQWYPVYTPNKLSSIIRLIRGFSYETACHELAHASTHIYRITNDLKSNFDDMEEEEKLCYIHGQLAQSFFTYITDNWK